MDTDSRNTSYSGEAVVVEIGGRLFGIDTQIIKSISELELADERLIIEPYFGSYSHQNTKIPLLNFADFFLLPSSLPNTIFVIVTNTEPPFAVIVSRLLGKVRFEHVFDLPQEVFRYPYLYAFAVEFNGSHFLLINLQRAFQYMTEHVQALGYL
jgi:chemotaxis signal transduction protein